MDDAAKSREELIAELQALRAELATARAGSCAPADPVAFWQDPVAAAQVRQLAEATNTRLYVYSLDRRYLFAAHAPNASPFDAEEMVGKTPAEMGLPAHQLEVTGGYFEQARKTGKAVTGPAQFDTPRGRREVVITFSPLRDAHGDMVAMASTMRDVTELRRAEEALKHSEERFRGLSEATFEGVAIHEDGRILEVNQAFADMFGYAIDELMGMSIMELAAPESREMVLSQVQAGVETPYEALGLRKDGSKFFGELYAKRIPYQGRMVRVTAARDITEHKRVEQALRESEEQWRILVATAPNMIVVTDAEGVINFVNRTPNAVPPERAYGLTIYQYMPPAQAELVKTYLARVRETGEAMSYEAEGVVEGMHRLWYHNDVAPIRRNGVIEGFLFISTDITALKNSEERLRKNELFLSRAQEIARMGCWEWDLVAGTEVWSDELYRIYGVEPGVYPANSESFAALVHPEDRDAIRRRTDELLAHGDSLILEFRVVQPGGPVRVIYSKAELIRSADGRPLKIMGVNQDVTELKRAYEEIALRTAELRKAQELDHLKSNFVNAVSHELRTPLTSIKGYAEFLEDEVGGPLTPQQLDFVKQLELGARRLERLVDDLLDFARIDAGTFKLRVSDADLTAKIRDTMGSLAPQARDGRLNLAIELPEEPLVVPMDAQRIGQVLLNLLNNAIKFTPPNGTITVRARPAGGHVRCEVADTGIGIAPEDLPKLFQRFTQLESGLRMGGGTGLGLHISKAIVEAHHGAIGVESTPGAGSTFWFTLPLAPREVPEERTEESVSPH